MERKLVINEINESYERVSAIISNAKYSNATKIINKLYNQSVDIGYSKGVNLYYENLIIILYYTHKNYQALTFLKHLIKVYKKSKNKKKLSALYRLLGVILSRLGDYSGSYYHLKKALEISINAKTNELYNIVNIFTSLAFNATNLGNFDKALNYVELGLARINTEQLIENNSKIFVKANIVKIRLLIKSHKQQEAYTLYNSLIISPFDFDKNELIYLNEIDIQFKIREKKLSSNTLILLLQTLLKNAIDIQDMELRIRTLYVLKNFHTTNKNFELANKYSSQLLKLNDLQKTVQVDLMNTPSLSKPFENEGEEFEIYHKKDLEVAARYQSNFFKEKIKSKHFDMKILFSPSKTLSGDYLGTFNLSNQDNYYLFVLADVVGKGITASYISFMLDGIIKSIIYNTDSFSLKNIINNINTILADALNGQGFVSLWAGILDINNNKLESVNAGHLPTFFLRKDKTISELNTGSTILGMFEELPDFESEIIDFNKGDSIIAYSDGVTEAMNTKGQLYEEKFYALIKNYAKYRDSKFIKLLEAELKLFQDKSQIQDDISCLLIDFKN